MDLWALSDLCTPWCIHVVVTLRIAEHLSAGVTQIDDLAAAAGAHSDFLARVLRHLVSRGVFVESSPGAFALNDAARELLTPGARLGFDLNGIGGRMAGAWSSLLKAVQTGAPMYDQVFGLSFWEDLAAHPGVSATFDALMGPEGHGTPNADIPLAGGWDPIRWVVDVGGGTGSLLAEILKAHPAVRGTLVDFPTTVGRSAAILESAGVADRVTLCGQSFFDPLPAGADLYILHKVLDNWPDREAAAILARCAEAVRPDGRVVVMTGVTDVPIPDPQLLMMVLVGGKDRTLAEFRALAATAGLEVRGTARNSAGRFIVECGSRLSLTAGNSKSH
ncbi:MAG TPA: methyltransferase [Bryobacteraceae bacterium]|nr:methyltransferase [Bryobacteraceae bacterium]